MAIRDFKALLPDTDLEDVHEEALGLRPEDVGPLYDQGLPFGLTPAARKGINQTVEAVDGQSQTIEAPREPGEGSV